ncbi:uncharacterized protein LOC105697015 [Orussus abietinus]|uniref:uncharacterized protein LOC105697015 n=1 Tax=Orussus abietinus TaxID=222816 RepID=UPI000625872D|nr:uncharacterized protein LOC105697015 [Orussus abietinus]
MEKQNCVAKIQCVKTGRPNMVNLLIQENENLNVELKAVEESLIKWLHRPYQVNQHNSDLEILLEKIVKEIAPNESKLKLFKEEIINKQNYLNQHEMENSQRLHEQWFA